MKPSSLLSAFGLVAAASAHAAGCLKGAIVGGVAGHAVGHGVLGTAGGCVAGQQIAKCSAARSQDASRPSQPSGASFGDDTGRTSSR